MKKLLFELPSQKHDYLSIFCGNETDALLHARGFDIREILASTNHL